MLAVRPEHLKWPKRDEEHPLFSFVSAPSPAKADVFPGRRFSPPEKRSQASFPQLRYSLKRIQDFMNIFEYLITLQLAIY